MLRAAANRLSLGRSTLLLMVGSFDQNRILCVATAPGFEGSVSHCEPCVHRPSAGRQRVGRLSKSSKV